MADEFDAFLAEALSPEEREPDRTFVARVQARIRLDEQLQVERRSVVAMLLIQFLGIAAVAAAAFWLLRSPEIASFASESPALLLLVLLLAFSFVILLFGTRGSSRHQRRAFSST